MRSVALQRPIAKADDREGCGMQIVTCIMTAVASTTSVACVALSGNSA